MIKPDEWKLRLIRSVLRLQWYGWGSLRLRLVGKNWLKRGQVVSVQQLPALSQMMETHQSSVPRKMDQLQGWRKWYGAIASLESLLKPIAQGLILSSPAPVTNPSQFDQDLTTVVFTPEISLSGLQSSHLLTFPPVRGEKTTHSPAMRTIPLSADDSLQDEQFCLVFTPEFSLLLVLTVDSDGNSHFD